MTSWKNLQSVASRAVVLLGFSAYCTLVPYVGYYQARGVCSGHLGMCLSEAHECPLNVSRHGNVDSALVIMIPLQSESTLSGCIPIPSYFVVSPAGIHEMVGINLAGIAYGKVIHNPGSNGCNGCHVSRGQG